MGGDGGGFRIIYFRPHLLVQDGSGRCASHPHAPGTFPAGADAPSPPPPPPSCPWAGMQGSRSRETQGSHKLLGRGVEEVEGGWETPSRGKEERGAKYKSKVHVPSQRAVFRFWEPGAEHTGGRGGVLENEEWEDSIRRRAAGLGQGAMAQEPSARRLVRFDRYQCICAPVCGPRSFPFGDL